MKRTFIDSDGTAYTKLEVLWIELVIYEGTLDSWLEADSDVCIPWLNFYEAAWPQRTEKYEFSMQCRNMYGIEKMLTAVGCIDADV